MTKELEFSILKNNLHIIIDHFSPSIPGFHKAIVDTVRCKITFYGSCLECHDVLTFSIAVRTTDIWELEMKYNSWAAKQ